VIDRPGFSNSQVRSAVIAPQGITLTLFAVAMTILSALRDGSPDRRTRVATSSIAAH
jgi:hypothetical protein